MCLVRLYILSHTLEVSCVPVYSYRWILIWTAEFVVLPRKYGKPLQHKVFCGNCQICGYALRQYFSSQVSVHVTVYIFMRVISHGHRNAATSVMVPGGIVYSAYLLCYSRCHIGFAVYFLPDPIVAQKVYPNLSYFTGYVSLCVDSFVTYLPSVLWHCVRRFVCSWVCLTVYFVFSFHTAYVLYHRPHSSAALL